MLDQIHAFFNHIDSELILTKLQNIGGIAIYSMVVLVFLIWSYQEWRWRNCVNDKHKWNHFDYCKVCGTEKPQEEKPKKIVYGVKIEGRE